MKRASIAFALVLSLGLAGLSLSTVWGQDTPPTQQGQVSCPMWGGWPSAGQASTGKGPRGPGMMGWGCMSPGMMWQGPGATGPGMMSDYPLCPLMTPGAKVETKNGIQITITSDDAKTVTRLQKMAEMMRLTREIKEMDEADQKE